MRRARPAAVLAALALLGPAPALAPAAAQQSGGAVELGAARMQAASPFPVAELQGLDKVTARVSTFTAPVDEPVAFGGLTLRVLACWKNPPELTPESAAYLEVLDSTETSGRPIFAGWIYASSPAVNALEHPVYDVWLLDCLPAESEGGAAQDGKTQDGKTQDGETQSGGGTQG